MMTMTCVLRQENDALRQMYLVHVACYLILYRAVKFTYSVSLIMSIHLRRHVTLSEMVYVSLFITNATVLLHII